MNHVHLHALASPHGPDTAATSALIAAQRYAQLRRQLQAALAADDAGLHAALPAAMPEPAWRPELGIAATCAAGGQPHAAALQLLLLSGPRDLALRVTLPQPTRLLLDGTALHFQGQLRVALSTEALSIETADAVLDFRWNALHGWLPDEPAGTAAPSRRWSGGPGPRYLLEPGTCGAAGSFPRPWPSTLPPQPGDSASAARIEAAIARIGDAAPAYLRWIGSALHGVLLTTRETGSDLCSPGFPGLAAIAPGRDPLHYAELLVSAACQQKFHQLALLHATTLGGREDVRYVPQRRSYLTTRRALAAAHEHVNVALMLAGLAQRQPGDHEIGARLARRRLMLACDCVPLLQDSAVLAPAGAELWRALRELCRRLPPVGATPATPRATDPHPSPALA